MSDSSEEPSMTIDNLLRGLGMFSPPPKETPKPPTTRQKIFTAVSYAVEILAFILLFISFIATGLVVVGIFGMVSMGTLFGLGVINSGLLAVSGGIGATATLSTAISVRKIARDMRVAGVVNPEVMKLMKAAGMM